MTLKGTFNAPQYTPGRSWDSPPAHICSNCRTPTGKSAIRCKNEPKETKQ